MIVLVQTSLIPDCSTAYDDANGVASEESDHGQLYAHNQVHVPGLPKRAG